MSVLDAPQTGTDPTGSGPGRRSAPTQPPLDRRAAPSARAAAWLSLVALFVAAVTIPRSSGDGFGADTFGRLVAGTLEVMDDDTWSRVAPGDEIASVAELRTRTEGAELEVRGGSLTLSRGVGVAVAGDRLDLVEGAVLFESTQPFSVELGVVSGRGRGSWRVDAEGAARYAVYRGGLGVSVASGREVAVPSLRQIAVVDGRIGAEVGPLRYLAADPWDQRLLVDAFAVDDLLRDVESNLEGTYGSALQEPEFYRDFAAVDAALAGSLDRLAPSQDAGFFGPPAPTLIGVVVTDLLVRDARLGLETALAKVEELRTAGGTWGLIVRDADLGPADVRVALDRALRKRAVAVAEGTATTPRAPALERRPDTPTPTRPDGEGPAPTPPPTQGDPADPGSDPPDGGDPEPEPSGPLDPVEETVEDLGSLLDPVVPGASEVAGTASDIIDTVDDLLSTPPAPSAPSEGIVPPVELGVETPALVPPAAAGVVDAVLGGS